MRIIQKIKNRIKELTKLLGSASSKRQVLTNILTFSSMGVKRKQAMLAATISVIIISILAVVLVKSKSDSQGLAKSRGFLPAKEQQPHSKDIEGASDSMDPEKIWRFQIAKENEKLNTDLNDIKKVIDAELTKNQDNQVLGAITSMQEKLAHLEQVIDQNKQDAEITSAGIQRVQVTLTNKKQEEIKTVDNTIPAGAFAKAILLSGADAATSLNASSDPSPLLIRITDPGTLPRKFKGDLDDCHIIASGYGDLSSERVNIRLEKLTCVEVLTGELIQTQVAGYVAGEDGKAGMRGKVVAKETAYLANSLLGGVVGGFSSTVTPQNYVAPFSSNGLVSGPSNVQKFQSGFGQGMSSSMDRLSKYYIDRAEMLQPVIEIAAGRIVDVIFTEDAQIGSTNVKKEIAQKRDKARVDAAKRAAKEDNYLIE